MHEFIVVIHPIGRDSMSLPVRPRSRRAVDLTNVGIASVEFFAERVDFPEQSSPWPLRFSDRGFVFRRRLRFPIPNR